MKAPATDAKLNHSTVLTRRNDWSQIVPAGSDDDAVIVAVATA